MTPVSMVIRCHNEERHIGKLLTGIMQQTCRDVEVILVDSGSTDATLAIAQRFPVRVVTIRPEEFSFGRSLNAGCAVASHELIVIASAHVYPIAIDWIEKLTAPFSDPSVALSYGGQRGNEVTKFSEQQVFARWFPALPNPEQQHPFCNNANAAIRKSLWRDIPYNVELTGLEDLDWAKKAIARGYYLSYVPDAAIVHVHDESPQRLFNRYRREAIALKHIFPEEHFHLFDFIRLFLSNTLTDYYHAWHEGVILRNLREIPLFRLMQFWGTYRGFGIHGAAASRLKQTFYYPNELRPADDGAGRVEPDRLIDYTTSHVRPHERVD
jgi:glycosyltransferase involved in cell wall biosynthesis